MKYRRQPSTFLLDTRLHHPEQIVKSSPFLFTVICAIASRFLPHHMELHRVLMDHARAAAGQAMQQKTLETCQAFILLALYPNVAHRWSDDGGSMYMGCASRIAISLKLHLPATSKTGRSNSDSHTQAQKTANRMRTWLVTPI
jgi:hypothetical protein